MKRQLPLTPAALGSLAVVVLVAIGGYFGLLWTPSREVARLEEQLVSLGAQASAASQAPPPVTDVERASWQTVEQRVRERFIVPDDQWQLLVAIAQLARESGLAVQDIQLEGGAPVPGATTVAPTSFALPVPPTLALNPGVIRLTVSHQYRALVAFLDRLATADTYVAVQTMDVRRVEGLLQTDIRLVSFRWVQAP
jgi:hypothetical protein